MVSVQNYIDTHKNLRIKGGRNFVLVPNAGNCFLNEELISFRTFGRNNRKSEKNRIVI